jgi:hypothetical protein
MKKVFSVFLMVLSLLIGFQQAIIVMHFKLNQKAIEQKFCINKNKPTLQCHGTCFLRKQLKETVNPESAPVSIYQRVDMLPISIFEFKAKNRATDIQSKKPIYKETLYTEPYREIFVPPPVV